jgi:DNA-binding NarL/FixJ family response regulator
MQQYLNIPDMDGVTLTVAIKAVAPQCPVVLMAASTTIEIRQRAGAAGRISFCSSPAVEALLG